MRALVLVATLITLASCQRGDDNDNGADAASSKFTITSGGRSRTYKLYRPPNLPNPAPLVVMLHGGFGSGSQAEQSYGWDGLADAEGFAVAYPDGIRRAWAVGGGCCGVPGREDVDDTAFISEMVKDISERVSVDSRRIYATGMSNGAMMAYRLACDTDVFAAIGAVAGTLLGSCDSPEQISVIHIHGTSDTRVRYQGGKGKGVAHIDGPPVPELVARWRSVDGCESPVVTRSGELTTESASCLQSRAVVLITVAEAGHQWPGGESASTKRRALGPDRPSTALDATKTIWRFFVDHPKPR